MNNIIDDVAYNNLVSDILDNEEFIKMKTYDHHGITRYDHLVKISYYSYKAAKALKLNTRMVARAALLHDFFDSENVTNFKESVVLTFTHPKYAVNKASDVFEINEIEKDIIKSHMFPFIPSYIPKYAESWLVDIVDKAIGSFECLVKFKYAISYAANVYLLFLINNLR